MKILNGGLEGKKFLCGNDLTIADIVLAVHLMTSFQTVLDGGFRKAMKNVQAWAEAVYALPSMQKCFGNV